MRRAACDAACWPRIVGARMPLAVGFNYHLFALSTRVGCCQRCTLLQLSFLWWQGHRAAAG